MEQYRLEQDEFIIEDYDRKPTFCSFLPGLAGIHGIPLWTFYVNRGQGMTSFGIHHKDNAIMEFFPANIAYENTSTKGFRTFIKVNGKYFEPFYTYSDENVHRNMYIRQNSFSVEEINNVYGIKTTVDYFIIPNENYGAVVRDVSFENISGSEINLEILDGMPRIIPYGIAGKDFREMANLMKAWNDINNIDASIPIYATRASTEDSDEVTLTKGGYYYLSFTDSGKVSPIYDPIAIFEQDTSLTMPVNFVNGGIESVLNEKQCYANKICCGFTPLKATLAAGGKTAIHTLIGYTDSDEFINNKAELIIEPGYLAKKRSEADILSEGLTADIATKSGDNVFDMYLRQCYLDNFLRGGYPFVFNKGENQSVVHLFSRRHGDPERDYNYFSIAGEYYSQGDGNFRDVSQNRRNDVLFHPQVGDFNIKTFFSLICADGYNPLSVKGSTFTVAQGNEKAAKELVTSSAKSGADKLLKLCEGSFTPGEVINGIYRNGIELYTDDDTFLTKLLYLCKQNIEAQTHEGYWSDHWDYNMDLIDSYLKVFPDKLEQLLFENRSYRYFDSERRVLPRSEKYVLNGDKVRQYGANVFDEEKYKRGYKKGKTNWLKTSDGKIYETDLTEKLISLIINKFALLDPYGMGIEMEGGKPGWNDAMNGLPGLFGSGMSETLELLRMLNFLKDICVKFSSRKINIPKELNDFIDNISRLLENKGLSSFEYWDKSADFREMYRESVRFELSGEFAEISLDSMAILADKMIDKVNAGIDKAIKLTNGLCPTYLTYNAVDYEIVTDENGNAVISSYGNMPSVKVKRFEVEVMPLFLEAPCKCLRVADKDNAIKIYDAVKSSNIYDKQLKMYKTCEPLTNMSMEAGRVKAFTPGWFEHESIFLHMEYKYMLSILESGLYERFYEDMKNVFIPFMDPKQYGRSILENSSFLASSANPDPTVHGRGFVSRLSGSTTEVVSMWAQMFLGKAPFVYDDKELALQLKPNLPGWLFDENGEISFSLLKESTVTLHNPQKKDTFGEDAAAVKYIIVNDEQINGDKITGDIVYKIREGIAADIHLYFE